MLLELDEELKQLCSNNPEADASSIKEATEKVVCTKVEQASKSKEAERQNGEPEGQATYLDRRGVTVAP
jgi:predicted DNA-binding protein